MAIKNTKNYRLDFIADFEEAAISHEVSMKEAGYWGQGSSVDGSATFRGGPFGFGGTDQLAASLSEPVKKLKKAEDEEAVYNVNRQQKINGGYPASQSTTGFAGGDSSSGIRSGPRVPNTLHQIALTTDEITALSEREPEEEYFGFDTETGEESLKEQGAGAGWQGPQRGVASDQNYRDLPGWPRHNSIEKQGNFIPGVEGDEDGDGEEDEYLSDAEYVNDVLRLNGLDIKPGHTKRLFGADQLEEHRSLLKLFTETENWPDPNRGTERFKQGNEEETPMGDDWLIEPEDFSSGHASMPPAEHSPGALTYGQIGAPKSFVPDDWEQRHPKTKEAPIDEDELKTFIENIVREMVDNFRVE